MTFVTPFLKSSSKMGNFSIECQNFNSSWYLYSIPVLNVLYTLDRVTFPLLLLPFTPVFYVCSLNLIRINCNSCFIHSSRRCFVLILQHIFFFVLQNHYFNCTNILLFLLSLVSSLSDLSSYLSQFLFDH